MSKIGNYRPCKPRRFSSECQKGLKCQKLSLTEKMTMTRDDRKTGYVCKPSNKYTKVHSRIEREREREREEDEKRLLGSMSPLQEPPQQVIENQSLSKKISNNRSFFPFRRIANTSVSRAGSRNRKTRRHNKRTNKRKKTKRKRKTKM